MDLGKYLFRFSQVFNIIKYVCHQKMFCASELEDKFGIPHTTLYRDLENWCENGYLTKRKKRSTIYKNSHNVFTVTDIGLNYFIKFLKNTLDTLEMSNIEYTLRN